MRGLFPEALLGALDGNTSILYLLWSLQTDEGVLMAGGPDVFSVSLSSVLVS